MGTVSKTLLAGAALVLLPLAVPADPAEALADGRQVPKHAGASQNVATASAARQPSSGLSVTLNAVTPAYLRAGERLNVSGTITNLDEEPWTDLQAYLLRPGTAATTTEEVGAMAETSAKHPDGERIIRFGLYRELGALGPGETTRFSLSIPFRQLGLARDAYGVYTLAVQVLAYDELNERLVAGRARSLIPLMPADSPPVDVATVWPFRADVVREPDGDYPDRAELLEAVMRGGRLRNLLDLAQTSGSTPTSLLLDPALLDTLRRIVHNDDTGPPQAPDTPSESPTGTDTAIGAMSFPLAPRERAAATFLDDLTALARQNTVWAEGYGGPDLTALADYEADRLYRTITRANDSTLSEYNIQASRAYAPTGDLDVEALESLGSHITTFVSSDQVRRWSPSDGPIGTVHSNGSKAHVVVSDSDILDGGLKPEPTDTALQVRQRLLAETAVLSLQADAEDRRQAPGLVMLADDTWNPGPRATPDDFFAAFDAPWITGTTLSDQIDEGPSRDARRLQVQDRDAARVDPPIPDELARSADRIRGRGVIMHAITRDDERVLTYYDQAAALTISEQWRSDPEASQELADEMIADLDSQLVGVTVEAPEFVTLSSSTGRFPLTITNDLPWPITVGVRLDAEDGGIEIEQDEPIDVDPQQSTTVNVSVDAEDVAVTEVRARLTTPKGRRFGEPVTFKMRSSVVGTVIWIALGAAGAIIVLAVGRRIRRSTQQRAESDTAESATSEPE